MVLVGIFAPQAKIFKYSERESRDLVGIFAPQAKNFRVFGRRGGSRGVFLRRRRKFLGYFGRKSGSRVYFCAAGDFFGVHRIQKWFILRRRRKFLSTKVANFAPQAKIWGVISFF